MSDRPSKLWKDLPPEKRLAAATAFWSDEDEAAEVPQIEAIMLLAKRLNFRPKSMQAMPVERRAKQLAQLGDVSDAVAARALVSYHFADERPLMAAFLDAVGIKHENGLITEEEIAPPDEAKLRTAVETVRAAHPEDAVTLYLKTLAALDNDTWAGLKGLLTPSS
jgi:hypothetical protein